MKLPILQAKPYAWALAYGILTSVVAIGISFFEGTLFSERIVHAGTKALIQYPYTYNISTILDFAIFNPIAIFFLLRTRNGFAQAFHHFKKGGAMSLFNQIGIIFTSTAVGFSAMWFYFQGFIGGTFFSESFAIAPDGTATISLTGWAIFVFTSIFISFVVLVTIEFGHYLLFVRNLNVDDFRFTLPPNVGEDVRIAVTPCINVAYILVTLFVVLSVFVFRDFYEFDIRESHRVWLFAPYVVACLIAFLPFWHLHQVMSAQKRDIIDTNNSTIEKDIVALDSGLPGTSRKIDPYKLTQSVDKIEKLQSFYGSIPVWPTTPNMLIVPNMSFLLSAIALIYKIATTFQAAAVR